MRIKPCHVYISITVLAMLGCGGGGSGDNTTTSATENFALPSITSDQSACTPSGGTVNISGTISYERVPFSSTLDAGLDYNNLQTLPVREADIQALGTGDCVMASGVTSTTGTYSLTVSENTNVKIRVKARTAKTGPPTWDFEVRDNTSSNGLYVLDGSSANSGVSNSTRNLTATTGWGGSSYTATRAAGPFALLDSVYDALQTVVAVDATVVMDDADIFWSVNNSTANGTISNGEIGGSFYTTDAIYILGQANSDTDEFDKHVVIHEWGHYLEDNLSRVDSVGGSHTVTEKLDMRVALSEGFSNTFSGIVAGDPIYRDSFGAQQNTDFQINVETNASTNTGWFNEGSVQTILYDIFDSAADANDGVNLGFSAIYNALTNTSYTNQASLTTIFSLTEQIKSQNAGSAAAIDTIIASQSIEDVADFFDTTAVEDNDGGDANNLPVYKQLDDDNVAVQVCSSNTEGTFNKLGNRQFLRLTVASTGNHTITATRASGIASANPDVIVYRNGTAIASGTSSTVNTETLTNVSLSVAGADVYVVEVYHTGNVSSGTAGDVCFNVSVT